MEISISKISNVGTTKKTTPKHLIIQPARPVVTIDQPIRNSMLSYLFVVSLLAAFEHSAGFVVGSPRSVSPDTSLHASEDGTLVGLSSRKQFLSVVAGSTLTIGSSAQAVESIAPCKKDPDGAPANCVSTASVKQVDLYMAPWTWSEGTSAEEVANRITAAISDDPLLTVEERSEDNLYLRVKATRNFATPNFAADQIEFLIRPDDRIVLFRSQQIDGPTSLSDFGANRKRLDELRKRTKILKVMGAEFSSADAGPREGVGGQLKAFWGLQSGSGYESILLGDD